MIGVYPEDVYRSLVNNNILFRVSFLSHEWEECLNDGPIMVLMMGSDEIFGPEGHWIVLTSKEIDSFVYLAPWYSRSSNDYVKRMKEIDFYKNYSGIACQIVRKLI